MIPTNTNKKITLTEDQLKYVMANYKHQKISEMALAIYTSHERLRRNMRFLKLESPFRQKKKPVPNLKPKQKVFVFSNYKKITVSEMARQLKVDFYVVYKFLNKNGLKARKNLYHDEPQIHIPADPVKKTSFERPPAVYSNTNYQQAYL